VIEQEVKPEVVILGTQEYIKMAAAETGILKVIGEESKQKETCKFDISNGLQAKQKRITI
jgi:hypothetical protein